MSKIRIILALCLTVPLISCTSECEELLFAERAQEVESLIKDMQEGPTQRARLISEFRLKALLSTWEEDSEQVSELCEQVAEAQEKSAQRSGKSRTLQNGQIPGYRECIDRLTRTCPNCSLKKCCDEVGGDRYIPGTFPTCEKVQ